MNENTTEQTSRIHPDRVGLTRIVLVAGTSGESLFEPGLVSGEEHPGALLTLLDAQQYDRLVLLSDDEDESDANKLCSSVKALFPEIGVDLVHMAAHDRSTVHGTDYFQHLVDRIRAQAPDGIIHVLLDEHRPEQQIAWMRILYRNEGMALLQASPVLHASTESCRIEVVEESMPPKRERAQQLREQGEPAIDDIARSLDLVGCHPLFTHMLEKAYSLANFDVPVLICGENGTGKRAVANFIWKTSQRSWMPMRNAAPVGLPEPLENALLFGSDNDAHGTNSGILSASNNGTLLVENVENLFESNQEALAAFIKTGRFRPHGSGDYAAASVRLVFTSDRDSINGPEKLIRPLKDLLMPTMLRVPALRERRDDIPLVALHYLRRINTSMRSHRSMPRDMLRTMQNLLWPGNVLELKQSIERAALLSSGSELRIEDLTPDDSFGETAPKNFGTPIPDLTEGFSLEAYLSEIRRRIITRALNLSKGNQSEAARLLHITPQAVHQFLKYGNRKK